MTEDTEIPKSMTISSDYLNRIDGIIEKYMADKTLPGAVVLVAQAGKVAYLKAFGKSNESQRLDSSAIFRLASMGKPMLAAAIMQLFDSGLLSLTDPVSVFIPEFSQMDVAVPDDKGGIKIVPAKRPITIHHLLSMTGGLLPNPVPGVTASNVEKHVRSLYDQAEIYQGYYPVNLTISQHVKSLSSVPLIYHPEEGFGYGGGDCFVLARIVELISGLSFDDYLAKNIFITLKMTDTFYYPSEAQMSRITALYRAAETQNGTLGQSIDKPENGMPGTKNKFDPWYLKSQIKTLIHPGAGLYGTCSDIYNFAQMLANGGIFGGERLLSQDAVRLMTTNQIGEQYNPHTGNKFGYMMFVQETDRPTGFYYGRASSFGMRGITGPEFWVNPFYGTVVVFMTHAWRVSDIIHIKQRIAQVVNRTCCD